MENISSLLTQVLFVLVVLVLPVIWWFNRPREQTLSGHYDRLKFKSMDTAEFQRFLKVDHFALLAKSWLSSGTTSESHVGRFENMDMAQFTLSQSDGSPTGRHQTVTFIKGEVALPQFLLRPENIKDKVLDRFKSVDIDFDSHPHFSEAYHLEAMDEAAARHFFTDRLLDYLQEHTGFSIETSGSDVLVFREYKRVNSAADIDVQLRLAHNLYQRFLELGQHSDLVE